MARAMALSGATCGCCGLFPSGLRKADGAGVVTLDPSNNMPVEPNQRPAPGQKTLISTQRVVRASAPSTAPCHPFHCAQRVGMAVLGGDGTLWAPLTVRMACSTSMLHRHCY